MLVLRLVCLGLLALAAGCIEFEREEGTSATGADENGDPTTGGSAPVVTCDPLIQDCAEGQACALFEQQFACIPVAVDGGVGDACITASECGAGLACCPSELVPGCDGQRCCASLCDVGDGDGAGCPAGTACEPVFSGPNVPVEYQDYGVCKASK